MITAEIDGKKLIYKNDMWVYACNGKPYRGGA